MKKQLLLIGIILMLLIVGLSGCNENVTDGINKKSDTERIVGIWEYQVDPYRERITFAANGSFYSGEKKGNYLLENDYINISLVDYDGSHYQKSYKYTFENDDTLNLEDIEYSRVRVYYRVE